MTSVAVLVAMVKLVVRLVDFISLGRVRAKPYIGMTPTSTDSTGQQCQRCQHSASWQL